MTDAADRLHAETIGPEIMAKALERDNGPDDPTAKNLRSKVALFRATADLVRACEAVGEWSGAVHSTNGMEGCELCEVGRKLEALQAL